LIATKLAELHRRDRCAAAEVLQQCDQAQHGKSDRADRRDLDRVDATCALASTPREQRRIEREARLGMRRRYGQIQIKP
jgi:hypothetical protein